MNNDMMPMGMPPVMVDYEDFSQFMAQEDRIKEKDNRISHLESALKRLGEDKIFRMPKPKEALWIRRKKETVARIKYAQDSLK